MAKRALVVDDDPVSRGLLAKCTSAAGFLVTACEDGRRAWELLQQDGDIGLIVSDMVMPGMTGAELLEAVRGAPGLAQIPVLLVSGAMGAGEAVLMGHTRFVPKSAGAERIAEEIRAMSSDR